MRKSSAVTSAAYESTLQRLKDADLKERLAHLS